MGIRKCVIGGKAGRIMPVSHCRGPALLVILSMLFLSGCGSVSLFSGDTSGQGDVSEPASTGYLLSREEILTRAGEVKSGEVVKINDKLMVMGDLYTSASGLQCRRVTILGGDKKETRLACKQGPDWCLTKRIISE